MISRRLGVVLIAIALIAAACGDDDGDDDTTATEATTSTAESTTSTTAPESTTATSESSTTTTEPVELTASWPGVSEDTIKLAFLYVDFDALSEMGLYESDDGDSNVVIEALVDDLNARGGILGRQIEPYVELFVPISVVDAEALCLRLTEDTQVFAVLGALVGPTEAADGCFTDLGETIKVGGTPSPEDLERAKAPWYVTSFRDDRSYPAIVNLFDQESRVVEPLAVIWASEDEETGKGVVLPELERLGYEVEITATQLSDVSDRTALDAEWSTIIERLRVDGVNTALLVGSSAGINGANQLVRQGWEGEILLVSHGLVISIGGTAEVPLEDLEGILGTMGATPDESWALDATQDCVAAFEAANPDITVVPSYQVPEGGTDWATPLVAHCLTLRLFELIATAAGPDLTHETFVAGAESLGEIELPNTPLASLGPGKIDATDGMRLGAFDPTIGEAGGGAPAGDLVRVP